MVYKRGDKPMARWPIFNDMRNWQKLYILINLIKTFFWAHEQF